LKTLTSRNREEKQKYKIPRRVQDTIPIQTIWPDGIFLVGKDRYSMTYQFQDINYSVASLEDKKSMFMDYSALLNSLDSGATTKLTIHNRRMSQSDLRNDVLIPHADDGLDHFRDEYNGMLQSKVTGAAAFCQDKYITVTVTRRNIADARAYFARIGAELGGQFSRLGSRCEPLRAEPRLSIFQNMLRADSSDNFQFDLKKAAVRGHSFLDAICPSSMRVKWNHLALDGKYGRVLFLRDYASFIKDTLITDLTALNREILLSIDILPVPMDEAIKEVNKRTMSTESNINGWQRRQNQHQNYTAMLPIQLEQQRQENKEFMNDLTTRNQRMMLCTVTLIHFADSLDALNRDTEAIRSISDQLLCQFSPLCFQQLEGLKTVLPYGCRKIHTLRTLTTESLAALMPFRVQEIMDRGGIYFGENSISRNLILVNKSLLMNPNAFVLGVPGSGKSFSVKELAAFLMLATKDDVLVCDPENEYGNIVESMGGSVIHIASGGKDHINPLDMVEGYGDGNNPISEKSEFMMALFEQLTKGTITGKQFSIIDRCTAEVYADYHRTGRMPTLITFRDKLLDQPEPEAQELALVLEAYATGSLDAFAHPTNVDTNNRVVVYDILGLGEQLKTLGLLVITDAMLNRVTENWKKGVRTHIIIDEFHVVFENEHSANFFASAWRRFRKRNAYPTAITQNVEFLLDSVLARTMLSNSELVVMLNQAAGDQEKLAHLFHISQDQMSYISNAEAGCGLIRYGSTLVPFENHFPKDTDLYKLMSTKPGENS
jgi:hypothetical protein